MAVKKTHSKKIKNTATQFEEIEEPARMHVKQVKCKNERQKELKTAIEKNEVTICSGSAGTGKTYISLYTALKLLERGYKKIILVKSVQTLQSEELGFVPGTIEEKVEPFLLSFKGNLSKMIDDEWVKELFKNKTIEFLPLAYIRGITIDDAIVIIDECQNLSINTFKSIITRIGDNSKYVILGDIEQIDMKRKSESSLEKVINLFRDSDIVKTVEFKPEDCVRNPIIPKIIEKLNTIECPSK